MDPKLEKLNRLLDLLQNDTVTPKQLEQFLTMVVNVIKQTNDGFKTLSAERLQEIQNALSYISVEHNQVLKQVDERNSKAIGATQQRIDELTARLKTFEGIKSTPGEPGLQGDPGPRGKPGNNGSPDTGEQIVDKINQLPEEPDFQIDASHIKNLPVSPGGRVGIGGARNVAVYDESTIITKALRAIKFAGVGVQAIESGGIVTVTITGGGGGSSGIAVETPSGTQDGNNTTFTVANTPVWLSVNGQELYENVDYSRSGTTLTYNTAPLSSDVLRSFYISASSSGTNLETPSGTQDGVNQTFTVSNTPVWITVNGQALFENAGYTLSSLTLTLDVAPLLTDVLRSHY